VSNDRSDTTHGLRYEKTFYGIGAFLLGLASERYTFASFFLRNLALDGDWSTWLKNEKKRVSPGKWLILSYVHYRVHGRILRHQGSALNQQVRAIRWRFRLCM
jgi:hypothetical protein